MVHIFISIMNISSPNPMFGNLLGLYHRDDSIKWSYIGFDEEITQAVSIGSYLDASYLKLLLFVFFCPKIQKCNDLKIVYGVKVE